MTKGLKIFLSICAAFIGGGMLLAGVGVVLGGHIPLDDLDDDGGVVSLNRLTNRVLQHHQRNRGQLLEFSQDTQPFDSVDIETGSYNITFVEDDSYGVRIQYYEGWGKPHVRIDEGALEVTDTEYGFSFNKSRNQDNTQALVEVHYPKGVTLREVELDCLVGTVDLSGITARSISGELEVGEITGTQVVSIDELSLESAVGSVQLSGTFTGKNEISCDMGDVLLNTTLGKEQYNTALSAIVGEVLVDGASVEGQYSQSLGSNRLEIQCSMGNAEVNFGVQAGTQSNAPISSESVSGVVTVDPAGHHWENNHTQGQHI